VLKKSKAPFFFLVSATKTTCTCTYETFDSKAIGAIYRIVIERIKIY
jgi:hypothetical protein